MTTSPGQPAESRRNTRRAFSDKYSALAWSLKPSDSIASFYHENGSIHPASKAERHTVLYGRSKKLMKKVNR